MKKLFLLFSIIVCIGVESKAQYVDIPDSNFRETLKLWYPSCFNASSQMDTTCSPIVEEDSLNLSYEYAIVNIEGIKYFKHLTTLEITTMYDTLPELPASLLKLKSIGSIYLTKVTNLPANLKYLDISGCQSLQSIPALPPNLEYFDFHFSSVYDSLPALPNTLRYLDCSNTTVHAFTSLPDSLRDLYFIASGISYLPALPGHLENLNCSNCNLSYLPSLPSSMTTLLCALNHLTSLPALPANLKLLECAYNTISEIPTLPLTLKYLNCGSNILQALPALPSSITELYFYNNKIRNLPLLPNTLRIIYCGNNSISNIPMLPDSLLALECGNDSMLSTLPTLPLKLKYLYCNDNQLTSLPSLPPMLAHLDCQNNKLTSLPELPNELYHLNCSQNNIYCLPKIPKPRIGFYEYWIGDKIKCLPNRPPNFNPYMQIGVGSVYLPLCNPTNNRNHCEAFPVMHGTVFYDLNANGSKDAGEPVKKYWQVSLSNNYYTYTNENGEYEIAADSIGDFNLSVNPPVHFDAVPASQHFNFSQYDTMATKNFALQANSVLDSLEVKIYPINWAAKPGFSFPYMISYTNTGTTVLLPNIVFNYDNTNLNYASSTNTAVVNSGNHFTLNAASIAPGEQEYFIAYFQVKTTAVIGDSIAAKLTVTANGNVYTDSNKVDIRGPFDPNDKEATPQLSPSQVAAGKYIDYTIHFQNIGNDTAINVIISDTLSSNLQAASLQLKAASHGCKTTVKGNVVYFEFLNILLPGKNRNEPKSHGFVSFSIKPVPTVTANTTIPNKAAIYFDYNRPVITNTAGTLIKNFTVVPLHLVSFTALPQFNNTTALSWITSNEINTKNFVIEQSNDAFHFTTVATVLAKGRSTNNYNSTVNDLNNNLVYYRLKMVDIDGSFTYSPVIKIDRRKNTTGFNVLSNPVKDAIIININDQQLNGTSCRIINMQGAVVKQFLLQQGSQTVDVKSLPAGIYYLKTSNGSVKILIQQ